MKIIDDVIEKLEYEKRSIGEIIDDRSLNRIPFSAYVKQYGKLERIINACKSEQE